MKEPDLLESIRHNNKIMEDCINSRAVKKGGSMQKITTADRIKKYLLSGKSLTVLQALRMFGTTELRSKICRLAKKGYSIDKEIIHKDGKSFMKYWIQK